MDSQFIVEYAELAKRLNVTETARFLNMSQPTLSKHITALEKRFASNYLKDYQQG